MHSFVTGYLQEVKDCYLAETKEGTLVISCSSSEILSNATSALEQVTDASKIPPASADITLVILHQYRASGLFQRSQVYKQLVSTMW